MFTQMERLMTQQQAESSVQQHLLCSGNGIVNIVICIYSNY
jgi:hypothetical protein